MFTKIHSSFLPIMLVGIIFVVSGCGFRSSAAPGPNSVPGSKPDSVKIEIDEISQSGPGATKPVVTLATSDTLQQLYAITYTLPQMPDGQACTQEAGPSYKLTFLLQNKTLGSALANREGCDPVTITGEQHDRTATKEFWTLLDKAIYQATPPAHPTQLSIMHVPPANQVAQTALITNIANVQRLYTAILALPLASYGNGEPTYQLVFHEKDLAIPATTYQKDNLIFLDGNHRTRGGWYTMNDQFKQLLGTIVSSTTSAPAHPDQLSLELSGGNTTSQTIKVTDMALIQKLYTKTQQLPLAQSQQFPNCVGDDKVNRKGTWYGFSFSQWSLPVLNVSAYEGCASFVNNATQQYLQGDQEFWSLVHNTAR